MTNKPAFATIRIPCPHCGADVETSIELDPLPFDQEHFITCDACKAGFVFFFETMTSVTYPQL